MWRYSGVGIIYGPLCVCVCLSSRWYYVKTAEQIQLISGTEAFFGLSDNDFP